MVHYEIRSPCAQQCVRTSSLHRRRTQRPYGFSGIIQLQGWLRPNQQEKPSPRERLFMQWFRSDVTSNEPPRQSPKTVPCTEFVTRMPAMITSSLPTRGAVRYTKFDSERNTSLAVLKPLTWDIDILCIRG